jgi:E3 SUMO-protein ligase PIAS1
LRIDEYHGLDEPTWPDYGEILVNGVRLFDFKPLAQNTSLKKRKDSVYVLREKIKIGEANFVTLRELKPSAQEQA